MEALLGAAVAGAGLWLARLEPFVALPLLALPLVDLAVGVVAAGPVAVAVGVALALGSLAEIQIGSRSITCRATACNHSGEGKVVLSRAARIITRQ